MKKLWKKILVAALIAGLVLFFFMLFFFIKALSIVPGEKKLLSYKNATASLVLSREGELIGKFFTENRTNVSYLQLPAYLINALIATEDIRFYNHRGVDSRSLLRVFIKTILLRKQTGGGSTITQQLAKNMLGRKTKGLFVIFFNKSNEAILARRIEKLFTKEEILTLYFNTVPFGENVYGIEAAAQRYFSKKVELLTVEESAVLVGILKANNMFNPRLYPEKARYRRSVVLGQMLKYGYLKKAEVDSLKKLPLSLHYANLEQDGPADYFLYQVKKEVRQILEEINSFSDRKWNLEEDGLVITTTLNLPLQQSANQSFRDHLSVMQKLLNRQYENRTGRKYIHNLAEMELTKSGLTLQAEDVALRQIFNWEGTTFDSISVIDSIKQTLQLLHAGLFAIDPATGAVMAWVGGVDFKTQPYDQILATRQMGSTFKPVLYAEALEEGIRPCYYLDNDSIVIVGDEEWSPANFDHTYGGRYSLAGALVHSMNIPSVNLLLKVRYSGLNSLWQRMGFSLTMINTPSVALGTAEANLEELAVAYSTFANGGFKINAQKIISIKTANGEILWQNKFDNNRQRILSERTCLLMNAILQKAVKEGTGTSLHSVYGVNFPMAGKTGTSHDYTDAWFVAYNPALVVVSRVGASLPAVRFNNSAYGSGSKLALPLVAKTLKGIQNTTELRRQIIAPFPELPGELEVELHCPDYKENEAFENLKELFKRGNKINYEKSVRKSERKKKRVFRKLFGTRE